MRRIIFLMVLLGGCVAAQEEKRECMEYITYEVLKEECVGGRGVAPQICIPYAEQKLYCTRYFEETNNGSNTAD